MNDDDHGHDGDRQDDDASGPPGRFSTRRFLNPGLADVKRFRHELPMHHGQPRAVNLVTFDGDDGTTLRVDHVQGTGADDGDTLTGLSLSKDGAEVSILIGAADVLLIANRLTRAAELTMEA